MDAAMTEPPRRRPKVAFLINSLIGGGAERVMVTLLAHSLAEREEFDISLTLLDIVDRAYEPPDWLTVRQENCKGSLTKSLAAMRRLEREVAPDIVLSFLERANFCNVMTARARPAVISERVATSAHFKPGLRGAVSKMMVRTLYPRADRIIAVSKGICDDLVANYRVPAAKLVEIANPVDLDAVRAKAAEAPALAIEGPYILAAGRLVENKNFALLIDAYAASGLADALVIIGQGEERDALLARARAAGVADRVMLPGFVKNPYALMRRARMFVLPSNAEGFPNGLVEAMAAGAPVISTNCAFGPAEILAETDRARIRGLTFAPHGILTPENDVASMAGALRAMDDEVRRRAYAQKALARAEAYGVAVAKDRYWAVIRETLARRVARAATMKS
jgi:N-acetylgalactosamine-N,N'-diacetylbacillosaminyl-diphospho-undecaprenol 4-alpha-N-acetylgalactosaminyltransferase